MRWKAASSSSGEKLATRQTRQPAFTAIPACHTLPPKSIAVPASGRSTVDGESAHPGLPGEASPLTTEASPHLVVLVGKELSSGVVNVDRGLSRRPMQPV